MMILTPIPNIDLYETMAVVMLSCGSFVLPAHIHSSWLSQTSWHLFTVNAWVKGVIVILSFFILSPLSLFSHQIATECVGIGVGVITGFFFVNLAKMFNRYFIRTKKPFSHLNSLQFEQSYQHRLRPLFSRQRFHGETTPFRKNFNPILNHKQLIKFSLAAVLFSALFEEILFRGLLVRLSFTAPNLFYTVLLLTGFTLIFGLSHVTHGACQVVEKTLFGIVAVLLTLILGSITAAIVAHGVFNYFAWSERAR